MSDLLPKTFPKKLAIGLVAVVLLAFGGFAVWNALLGGKEIVLSGEVQAREVKNASRFGGRVQEILVREGDEVAEGQLLILFEDTELQAKIADARATLVQAQAQANMLSKGGAAGQVQQAGSAVQQAEAQLRMLSAGGRPEELTQAESRVKMAEAQAAQAKQAFDNAQIMLDEGIISRQKYDSLRDAVTTSQSNLDAARATLNMLKNGGRPEERKIARARLSAAQAQYGQAVGSQPEEKNIATANVEKAQSALQALEAQLEEVRIKAPFKGYVSVIAVTEGELVPPGRPVVSVLDYSHLWTDVYVPETELPRVSLGQTVKVRARSLKNAEFQGRVALISPKSEFVPNSGGDTTNEQASFRVKIEISSSSIPPGQAKLYPGMKVDVLLR